LHGFPQRGNVESSGEAHPPGTIVVEMSAAVGRRMLAASACLTILLCACGGGSGARSSGFATPDQVLRSSPTADLALDPSGFRQLLSQLRGKPVVVNIWGSWCGPCRAEAPVLAAAAKTYGDRVQFIGVDVLDHIGLARAFIRQYGWTYPSVFDPTGRIRDSMGLIGQPHTVVISPTGGRFVLSGPATEADLRSAIESALGGAGGASPSPSGY